MTGTFALPKIEDGTGPGAELDFTIARLGECHYPSPLRGMRFTQDSERVLYHARLGEIAPWIREGKEPPSLEAAGPRERIYFDPAQLACGIVTCGGLCPGVNDVIRALVLSLWHHYGVRQVFGFRFGYEGLVKRCAHMPMALTPATVKAIHEGGGTILGSSRGPQDAGEMLDTLAEMKIGVLFTIGGDGTLRGAKTLAEEAARRGYPLSVIGIPKTIDNDVSFVQKTFGFETAVAEARRTIYGAHIEAEAARNGIGLVKLMGRDSGFIAAYSVLVESQVNFCLVPEVPFTLERFLGALQERLKKRGHAVIVAAEGAGQELMAQTSERDASGNVKKADIGTFLRDKMQDYFQQAGMPVTIKYFDPSYTIRSVPAIPHDAALCLLLGQCAVHAGMSGRTNMVVGFWNHAFTHVPIALAVSRRKKIDPQSMLWSCVLAATGQPAEMG